MRIAFILFNGVTFLDFIGFYDVIHRLKLFEETKDVSWDICGVSDEVSDDLGLTIKVDKVKPDLSHYDMIFIPGGMGTRNLRYDDEFITWIKQAERVKYHVSVCTGSLLLGAAGFLKNKKATTHPGVYDLLAPYCSEVIATRIVKDGNLITGGGVSTSIDLALYIIELLVNKDAVTIVKQQIDYPYEMQGVIEV